MEIKNYQLREIIDFYRLCGWDRIQIIDHVLNIYDELNKIEENEVLWQQLQVPLVES